MDKYNVINQIDTLQDLENDIFNWSRLPYEFKMRSDEECIRQHGMKNIQYYETIKSKLINNQYGNINGPVTEEYSDQFNSDARYEYSQKLQQSPFIVILDPATDAPNTEVLHNKYENYLALNLKFRQWSNYYSKDIYGCTVPEMFRILLGKIEEQYNYIYESDTKPYYESVCCDYRDPIDAMIYYASSADEIGTESYIHPEINSRDFESIFNKKVVPYFTPDEYNQFSTKHLVENMDYPEWKKATYEAVKANDEEQLRELGWNPSVPFNEDTINYAKTRQIKWFKKYSPTIIDVRNINEKLDIEMLEESTKPMRDLYAAKNLYPIFVVMSFSNTFFGYAERLIKNVTYSHVGLAVDSNLKEIFTFAFSKEANGLTIDTLDKYIKRSKDKAVISVMAVFVDGETRDNIYRSLNDINNKRYRTSYNFGNIINILKNKPQDFPYPENMSLVCSQFVDIILKLSDINLVDKSSNIVLPQDFHIRNNPRVYKVYEGLCTEYDEKKVEELIKTLLYKGSIKNIKYNDPKVVSFIKENFGDDYENSLNNINEMLTVENIIQEKKLPVRFSKAGNLQIDLKKDLEEQYQESHKLLTSYDENNLEGIKKELACMFYINTVIEKKIRKMKKNDEEYKPLIDLRARVLNDFKTYLKVVLGVEKDFDFSSYYQNSEYNTNTVTVDKYTLKYSGSMIKKLVKSFLKK